MLYKIIKNILHKEYINDIFNKKYSEDEGTSILRKKYKLEYIRHRDCKNIRILGLPLCRFAALPN